MTEKSCVEVQKLTLFANAENIAPNFNIDFFVPHALMILKGRVFYD